MREVLDDNLSSLEEEIAYRKVKALAEVCKACQSKAEVQQLVNILPHLGKYQDLPE